MKKIFLLILTFTFVFRTVSVFADNTIPEKALHIIESDTEITITDCDVYHEEVVIPSTYKGMPITSIDDYAFENYYNLKSITIPSTVTTIGKYAFSGCDSLETVILSDGLTDIGEGAFCNCTSLTEISLPKSVKNIGSVVFYGCTALSDIQVDENNENYCSVDGNLYNKSKTTIIQYAVGKEDTCFQIPSGVTEAGYYSFAFCDNLESVTIPDGVKLLNSGAFSWCGNLTDVRIPDSVMVIGNGTFAECTELTDISIPDKVTTVGSSAFFGCTSLTDITVPDRVTAINDSTFSNCLSLKSVTLPDGITTIGDESFNACVGLTDITLPSNLKSIGDYAFADCIGFTNVTIPGEVTSIGEGAFYFCDSLTGIILPEKVTELGNSAFYGCSSLKIAVLPESISKINEFTFRGCENLSTVLFTGNESDWNEIDIAQGNLPLENAEKIFNAVKKTYNFNATRNVTLTAITDYAVMSAPKIEPDGNTVTGWYTNENTDGVPLNFPYYGGETGNIETTLYAKWENDYIISTETNCSVSENGEKTFVVIPHNLPENYLIILALYNENKLIDIQSTPYDGKNAEFITNKNHTHAKIMVWDSFEKTTPLCAAERIY